VNRLRARPSRPGLAPGGGPGLCPRERPPRRSGSRPGARPLRAPPGGRNLHLDALRRRCL